MSVCVRGGGEVGGRIASWRTEEPPCTIWGSRIELRFKPGSKCLQPTEPPRGPKLPLIFSRLLWRPLTQICTLQRFFWHLPWQPEWTWNDSFGLHDLPQSDFCLSLWSVSFDLLWSDMCLSLCSVSFGTHYPALFSSHTLSKYLWWV